MKCTRIKGKAKKDIIVSRVRSARVFYSVLVKTGVGPLSQPAETCVPQVCLSVCLQTVLLGFKLFLLLVFGCPWWHLFPQGTLLQ